MNPHQSEAALEQIRGAMEHGDTEHAEALKHILWGQVLTEIAALPGQYISNKRMAEHCVLAGELILSGGELLKKWYRDHGRMPTLLEWRDARYAAQRGEAEKFAESPTAWAEDKKHDLITAHGDPNEIVAYTVGSFWFCLEHKPEDKGVNRALRSDLMPVYTYNCDKCGKRIS